jgi:hypothetical protein
LVVELDVGHKPLLKTSEPLLLDDNKMMKPYEEYIGV